VESTLWESIPPLEVVGKNLTRFLNVNISNQFEYWTFHLNEGSNITATFSANSELLLFLFEGNNTFQGGALVLQLLILDRLCEHWEFGCCEVLSSPINLSRSELHSAIPSLVFVTSLRQRERKTSSLFGRTVVRMLSKARSISFSI
jgi:hypothetical protein